VNLVADTNVIVSGLLWLGNPGRLLEAAANGEVTLYTSPALVAELRTTLAYDRLARRVQFSGMSLDDLMQRYLNVAILVNPATLPRIVRDPDDDHVLACAIEAAADLIVTGDADLLTLDSYQRIPVITPAEALRRLEAQKSRNAPWRVEEGKGPFTARAA
jgi:putative PIN family toxin of toxin-antitoxin system